MVKSLPSLSTRFRTYASDCCTSVSRPLSVRNASWYASSEENPASRSACRYSFSNSRHSCTSPAFFVCSCVSIPSCLEMSSFFFSSVSSASARRFVRRSASSVSCCSASSALSFVSNDNSARIRAVSRWSSSQSRLSDSSFRRSTASPVSPGCFFPSRENRSACRPRSVRNLFFAAGSSAACCAANV